MNKSFWVFIWERIKHNGVSISLIGIIYAILTYNFDSNKSIRLGIVIPLGIILIILLIVFVDAAYESFKKNRNILPRVICVKPYLKDNKEYNLFLLTPSNLFSNGIWVSIYYYSDEYEQLIAVGNVLNIQDDNKIQVLLINTLKGQEETVEKIVHNNKLYLDKTKIKPNIPYSMFYFMLQGGQNE